MIQIKSGKTHLRRLKMRVGKRAFNLALNQIPYDETDQSWTMLMELDSRISNLGKFDSLKMAVTDVYEYIRLHPDMEEFATRLEVSEEQLDAIFDLAMNIESTADPQ